MQILITKDYKESQSSTEKFKQCKLCFENNLKYFNLSTLYGTVLCGTIVSQGSDVLILNLKRDLCVV